jgi:ABC-type polysaccharide/polyol phosphate transport system ATPase subunit
MSSAAITVQDLHKSFRLPREQIHTLKERVLHPLRSIEYDELHALKGVTFTVDRGEFFGIVGRNGSGKSTLLKCLAGIYATDGGRIFVDGRMSTFIELGVGFNPDLAARDNIGINASMLGLSPREARRRFDQIIDFAELREFTDLKLKNYSSGMMVRLAFAVMIQVDAEVLIIDEVLAVGDAAFQQKCYQEFERIRRSGTTVLLVTHDMAAVNRFCDRALLLEHGRTVEMGDPQAIGMRYLQLNFSEEARAEEAANEVVAKSEPAHEAPPPRPIERLGDGKGEIAAAWFEDASGEPATVLPSGQPAAFAMRVRFHQEVEDPQFSVGVANLEGKTILAATTSLRGPETGRFAPGEEVLVRFSFDNILAPEQYSATPAVAHAGSGQAWIDWRKDLVAMTVSATRTAGGMVNIPTEIALERLGAAAPAASEEAVR